MPKDTTDKIKDFQGKRLKHPKVHFKGVMKVKR